MLPWIDVGIVEKVYVLKLMIFKFLAFSPKDPRKQMATDAAPVWGQ